VEDIRKHEGGDLEGLYRGERRKEYEKEGLIRVIWVISASVCAVDVSFMYLMAGGLQKFC